ncbi:DUF4199 domain-containing protein [Fulvivirga sp. M361]|uniref:DUF4199 domain-containing protein n=1 Tax=Fulvivirga sp. M361 TaxID=2594266 RepID=UPI001179A2A1|nr:DUF4199 domain-containing protein [Fulvivirga sp. M361]TRX56063.1 DUF4199 domain-containing protein [Fulvivirga sp. M361]
MEDTIEKSSVKQVSVKWGLITAAFSIVFFLIITLTETDTSNAVNWLGLIPFIVFLVLAHKEFKSAGDGFMSYGQGLGIGTLVSLVSAIISGIFRYVYIKFVDLGYTDRIMDNTLQQLEEQGMGDEQIEQTMAFTAKLMAPEVSLVLGIVMAVLFGFILSLIITAFTKNSNPEDQI